MSTCKILEAELSAETIAQRLKGNEGGSSLTYRTVEGLKLKRDARPAAVLIPLVCDGGYWQILFIRRSESLPEHKGQVAFPGGAKEPGENDAGETALRETFEEIGIEPENIRILGKLDEMVTNSGYLLTPVVGVLNWPIALKPDPDEVARVFTIPLHWLADPAHHAERLYRRDGEDRRVIYFDVYDGELLWGISARIMVEFLAALMI